MRKFYKIEEGILQVGSGEVPDDSWIAYEVGQEPLELQEALQKEQAEQELQVKLQEASQYLKDTDWYYARKAETGEEVPEEVVSKRIKARQFIKDNV